MPDLHELPTKVWLLLTAGPVFFLLAFVGLSVVFTALGVPASEVGAKVAASVPHVLLLVLACLGLGLFAVSAEVQQAWQLPARAVILADLAVGTVCGLGLAAAYLVWLSPLLVELQRKVGDFVPPGSTRQALTGSLTESDGLTPSQAAQRAGLVEVQRRLCVLGLPYRHRHRRLTEAGGHASSVEVLHSIGVLPERQLDDRVAHPFGNHPAH